jgi:protease-4
MFKKLLDEDVKKIGGITGFVLSLRKEITMWKLVVLILCGFICFAFFTREINMLKSNLDSEEETITTKQIKSLKHNVVAKIRIEGAIEQNRSLEKLLDEIEKSKKIKALLVVINSPGGDPNASEIIYSKLLKIKKKMLVVAFIDGYGTSGSYMVAMAAHKIVAIETAIVGSIGVIGANFDFTELMKKLGIGYNQYVTSEYKGVGTPFVKTTEIQKRYRQDIINQIYVVFRKMVKEARGLKEDEVLKVANAKVFIGKNAKDLKLIDEVGSEDVALEIINTKLKEEKLNDVPVQEIERDIPKNRGILGVSANLISFFSSIKDALSSSINDKLI